MDRLEINFAVHDGFVDAADFDFEEQPLHLRPGLTSAIADVLMDVQSVLDCTYHASLHCRSTARPHASGGPGAKRKVFPVYPDAKTLESQDSAHLELPCREEFPFENDGRAMHMMEHLAASGVSIKKRGKSVGPMQLRKTFPRSFETCWR